MNVSVRIDITKALRKLRDFPERQIPFAIASALTATAQQTATLLTNKLPEYFDRPTPFTMRAIGTDRATKTNQQSRVFIKRDQLRYLIFGVKGGTRMPRNKALPLAVEQPLNQYGNLPRNKLKQLLARKDVFSGKVNGVGGIWQRTSTGHLRLLITWIPHATYRKRYPFYELGSETARAAFPRNFRFALDTALRTAR